MKPKFLALIGTLALAPAWADPGPTPAPAAAPAVPDGLGIPEGAAPERLRWNRMPLVISLPLHKERLVTFPGNVRVGFPPELTAAQIKTQIVDGTLYWTALQPFAVTRVQVQAIGSGEIYLVDLSASAEATDVTPVEILGADSGSARRSTPPPKPSEREDAIPPADYASLTRMAAQHLYAPQRLLKTPAGVYRTPVGRQPTEALFHHEPVRAEPLIAWRSGTAYITAVKLSNRGYDEILLDPRTLRGEWRTCAFQHARLLGRGDTDGGDVSAAYLISDRPFEEALRDGR